MRANSAMHELEPEVSSINETGINMAKSPSRQTLWQHRKKLQRQEEEIEANLIEHEVI